MYLAKSKINYNKVCSCLFVWILNFCCSALDKDDVIKMFIACRKIFRHICRLYNDAMQFNLSICFKETGLFTLCRIMKV